MKKAYIFGILIFLLAVFCGCNRFSQRSENNLPTTASTTTAVSASETETRTYEQVLADFKALEPQDIRAVDIVLVRNAESAERAVKTFTDAADIQEIFSVFADADVESIDGQTPSNGWSIMVRIWLQMQNNTDIDKPILVSPQASGYISIDGYVYSVKSDAYVDKLTSIFEASPIQEKAFA